MREVERMHHHGPCVAKWIGSRTIYNLKIPGYLQGVSPM